MIKGLNEKVVKGLVAQAAINNFLLDDQLRVTPQRFVEIKSQPSTHKVTIIFLEPTDFETIAADVVEWRKFVNGLIGPT